MSGVASLGIAIGVTLFVIAFLVALCFGAAAGSADRQARKMMEDRGARPQDCGQEGR